MSTLIIILVIAALVVLVAGFVLFRQKQRGGSVLASKVSSGTNSPDGTSS